MAQRVFLSYRRSDSAVQGIPLKVVLQQKLPDVLVFVDTQSVNPSSRSAERPKSLYERIVGGLQ